MTMGRCVFVILLPLVFMTADGLPSPAFSPVPAASQTFAGGTLVRYEAFPSTNVDPRNVYVWTPRGYPQGHKRYDVIYMPDGQNLFLAAEAFGGNTWGVAEHVQALMDAHKIRPTIIVGIWNTPRRGQEYAPTGGQSAENLKLLAKDWGGPIISEKYVRFVTEELKPFIDRNYRTDPRPAHTCAMGSSMGGLISLYSFVQRPDVFGGAACLSTHWIVRPPAAASDHDATPRIVEAFLSYVDERLPPADRRKLYFDHGTADLDSYYAPFQEKMDAILRKHGYARKRNEMSLVFPGATHNEQAWRERIDQPLLFLLKK